MKWLIAIVLVAALALVFWQVESRKPRFQSVETPPLLDESVDPSRRSEAIPMHHAAPPAKSPVQE